MILKKKIKTFLNKTFSCKLLSFLIGRFINVIIKTTPQSIGVLGLSHSNIIVNSSEGTNIYEKVNEIPSLTNLSERMFLYQYFSKLWTGNENVLEIGPFLGGTTRAIALGMLNNQSLKENIRLYTVDHIFDKEVDAETFSFLEPVFNSPLISEKKKEAIRCSKKFSEIFHTLHKDEPYYDLIVPVNSTLPQSPENESTFSLSPDIKFNTIFIDGCKSWYSTKYFFSLMNNHIKPGACYILQDYGYYQCFWIPFFVGIMKEFFSLVAYTHNTYAFILQKNLSHDIIDRRFPDQPEKLSKGIFKDVFNELHEGACERRDHYMQVSHRLQHAAALAYIGHISSAKDMILDVKSSAFLSPYDKTCVFGALESPTYRYDRKTIRL